MLPEPNNDFEPAEIMEELRKEASGALPPDDPPDRLSVSEIVLKPELFQPRGISERHIQELRRAIKVTGELEPLMVIFIGSTPVLIDGHHRVEAYEEAGVTNPVPVRCFQGSLEEAVLEAGKANCRAKLPMTTWERQEYAWRLVLLGTYSKRQVREASSVSDGQIANMRRVRKALGDDAYDCRNWRDALRIAKGREEPPFDEDAMEQWLDAQANEYADRLSKAFGTKLPNNTDLAARTLSIYFGRRLPDLFRDLRGYIPKDTDEDDEEEEF